MRRVLLLLVAAASTLSGYIPLNIYGPVQHRTDYASIPFLVNQNTVAGLTNASGAVWITANSDPMGAINGALAAWNAVTTSAARFAAVQSTTLNNVSGDGKSVITFSDTAATRTVVGAAIAVTVTTYLTSSGAVVDSDIFFNPTVQFSTTLAANTYDLQSVVTHELGHALGANHTNLLSATMFQGSAVQDAHQQTLRTDDIAFVSSLYPATGGNGYGTLTGTTSLAGTGPILGGLITAVDPSTGNTIGALTSLTDGTFSIAIPPGSYVVYVEPMSNTVLPVNLSLNATTTVTTTFQPGFVGGIGAPQLIPVTSGSTVSNVQLVATYGAALLTVPYAASGLAGGTGDHSQLLIGAVPVASGQSVDLVLGGGSWNSITANNILIYGPATLRPGSVRQDPSLVLASTGAPVFRATLDIPALTTASSLTVILYDATDIVALTGLIAIGRPQAVNAGSYAGGPVAPGEILSFFGGQLGPGAPVSNGGFDANGLLPSSLGNVTVTFDKTAAPLFYVSNTQINLQVPYEVSGQNYTVMTVAYNGTAVAKQTLSVGKSAPGIFVVTNADGSVNGPSAPGSAGSTLVVYGTGSGLTSVSPATGAASPAGATIGSTVTISGQTVSPVYSGLTAGSVGLLQVNVVIPTSITKGDNIPLKINVGGGSTQTVGISVR